MRVWLLKISEPLPRQPADNRGRTAMLGFELARRGHEVLWWNSSFDHQRKEMLLPDDAEVDLAPNFRARALRGIAYRRNFSLRRYVDHRRIATKFRERAAKLPRPDVLVVAMPDYHLAHEAVAYARARGIPVLVDIRDPWPDVFLLHVPRPLRPLLRLALAFDERKVRRTLSRADALTSMVSDWLAWGLSKARRAKRTTDQVFLIGASPLSMDVTDAVGPDVRRVIERVRGQRVVTFVGAFNANYDPRVVVRAAQVLAGRQGLEDVAFVIAGSGASSGAVEALARGVPGVHLTGWVNRDEMGALLGVSSVGVVPGNLPTEAFPNKAFTYLSAGLPVVSSNEGDLRRMLEAHRAGAYFPRGDHEALARVLEEVLGDRDALAHMAGRARALFLNTLEAGSIYRSFADHVERLAARSSPGYATNHGSEPRPTSSRKDSHAVSTKP